MAAQLNPLEAGARVFGVADKYALKIGETMSDPEKMTNVAEVAMTGYNMMMMGSMWQLASTMVKEMTEPLKSIVNK